MNFEAPQIDYAGLSPLIALVATTCIVLIAGLLPRVGRFGSAYLTLIGLAATAAAVVWQWGREEVLVAGALRLDELGMAATMIAVVAAIACVLLSIREPAAESAGHGAFYALLTGSVLGMSILAQAHDLITLFIGLELLSIPLYVMCGAAVRSERSIESGLKYLIVGSVGSAAFLYGIALLYGATGTTSFQGLAGAVGSGGEADDTLVLAGAALAVVGLSFKLSLAPFHQWAPDVYQGAPTPVTAFMAVATKAAAFIALARLLEMALGGLAADWDTVLMVLACASIVVGNIGALGQRSIKRLLGWSGIAQAGYMLVGISVADEQGLVALVFYLAAYALMNLAVFASVIARERESGRGDDISALEGIGRSRPLLAWPLTIGVLGLAGVPGTAGFVGKLFLIGAAVDGSETWLGVAIVVGTMVSLGYYLPLLSTVWMPSAGARAANPRIAGGAPRDGEQEPGTIPPGASRCALVVGVGVVCAAATLAFGIYPDPLVDWATEAASALASSIPG